MKNIKKSNMKEFVQDAKEFFLSMGMKEKETISSFIEFEKQTKYGLFTAKIDQELSAVYSVYGLFEDVEKAKNVFNCNPYTGKYNFHSFDLPLNEVYINFCIHFESVLAD